MAVTGPNTGFKIVNVDGGPYTQDLGQRYVSKDYLLDVYPNIAYNVLGNRTSPGLYVMGTNSFGNLGLDDTTNRSSPVQVGSSSIWKQICCGNSHIIAVSTSGGLWTWGLNTDGQLGDDSARVHRSSPFQVGSLTNWKQVTAGQSFSAAIKTDGTLWTWGNNLYGQLGDNSARVFRSSPFQIGSLTNWKQVSAGRHFCAAVKTDGTIWVWGRGDSGQGGWGTGVDRSSPFQVGSLTNWKQVGCGEFAALAVKTDGTLWGWGRNAAGTLGLNDTTNRSSPVQIGSLTSWYQATGGIEFSAAIQTNGTLWAWGGNGEGQLGLNDTTGRSSPVQVGSLTNWKSLFIGSGGAACACIKTDGTLWVWARNDRGSLGLGDLVHRSSPVQVGSLTNWKQISTGGSLNFSAGILDWSV